MARRMIFIILCVICSNISVFSAVLAYEGFDYSTSGLNGQSGGTGFSGSWSATGVETSAGSLSAPSAYGLSTTGGKVAADMSGTSMRRFLSTGLNLNPASQTTYYLSMLFERQDSSNDGSGEWISIFRLKNSSNQQILKFTTGSGENISITDDNATDFFTKPDCFEIGKTYLVVMKIEARNDGFDNAYIKLFDEDTAYITDDLDYLNSDVHISFDSSSTITNITTDFGTNQNYVYFDEFRIGTAWADVVGGDFVPKLAYEDFDYGTAGLNGQNGGTGFNGAWTASGIETSSTSLAAPAGYEYVPSGGDVAADNSGQEARREFAFDINLDPEVGDNLVYYFSVLFKKIDTTGDQESNEYIQPIRLLNSSNTVIVDYIIGSNESVATMINGGVAVATSSDYIEKDQTYLLVGKLLCRGSNTPQYLDTDDVSYIKVLKVGTDTVYSEPKDEQYWDCIATANCSDTISKVALKFGANQTAVHIDEFRVGTTWDQVVNNDKELIPPISDYLRDDYLHCSSSEISRIESATDKGLMNIRPVILPEGENFLGSNFHMGWPVAAMSDDTIIMHSRRFVYHTATTEFKQTYPSFADDYSQIFYCISNDAGKTWGPMIDIQPFFAGSSGDTIGGMMNIGTNNNDEFILRYKGMAISDDGGQNWALSEGAFDNCNTTDSEGMGPIIINHPVFGLMMFNGSDADEEGTPPWKAYIRRSTDDGFTWDDISWDTSKDGDYDYTWPKEPAALTWGPGHILLISRDHSSEFPDDGSTWAMSQHLYKYESGDTFSASDIVFETQRSNIEGNLWDNIWANDTADVSYNPVTGRIEVLHCARFGGGPGYDGNNTEVAKETLNIWSIDPDELLAGSNVWRFEGTMLVRNDRHSPATKIDGLHPGSAVIDEDNDLQHIYVYAGGHCGEEVGVFQIDRTLNTGQLSAYLKSSLPNCQYTKKITLDCDDLYDELSDVIVTIKLNSSNIVYNQFKANADDMYFTDSQQNILRHYIYQWNTSGDSYVLVKVPHLDPSSSDNHIFINWGDSNAHFYEYQEELNPDLDSFSVSFWVKNDTSTGLYYMVNKGNDSSSSEVGWSFFRDSATYSNRLRFRVQGNYYVSSENFTDTSNWHHVAGVLDRSNNLLKLYLDSVYAGSCSISSVSSIFSAEDYTVYSGSYGNVDDVHIIRQALTANDITALYNAGRNGAVSQAFVTLPTVTISTSDYYAYESNTANTASYTVTRTGSTTGSLDVHYYMYSTATNGEDYNKLSGTVTIPAGNSSAMITVTAINDTEDESLYEWAEISLLDGVDYDLGAAATAYAYVVDDDP